MGISLDEHPPGNLYTTRVRHTTQIVPPEVDQHGVLSPFLGVFHHLLFKSDIFLLIGASASCPGYGPNGEDLVLLPYQQFGGSSKKNSPRHVEVEMVRGWVKFRQSPINSLRIRGLIHFPSS